MIYLSWNSISASGWTKPTAGRGKDQAGSRNTLCTHTPSLPSSHSPPALLLRPHCQAGDIESLSLPPPPLPEYRLFTLNFVRFHARSDYDMRYVQYEVEA